MNPRFVFKNQHFVVIDKPVGVLSVPSRLGLQDPRPVAGILLQKFLGIQIYPLHRLDEDTSGLLMFGLTATASSAGNQWFERHEIIKTYEALSRPLEPSEQSRWDSEQLWECKLMRGKRRAYEASFGKPAVTKSRLTGHSKQGRSVWSLIPITGRSHQLRYEMARHGFPIDGDSLYGSQATALMAPGIDLRAFKLNFSNCSDKDSFELPDELVVAGIT